MKLKKISSLAALLIASVTATQAQIEITEVDPAGSATTGGANGNGSGYAADWFELWNSGPTAVDIAGWRMDDNSDSFALAVGLRGVTSIAPGQAVVFVEGLADGSTDSTIDANFETAWFGSSVPSGFTIGNYGGSGVGLSQTTDAVNIFNSASNAVAGVSFNVSILGATFDNAAGLSGLISQTSVAGVNGAFLSASGVEVGSPGTITAAPEPSTLALAGFAGIVALVGFRRMKNCKT